MNSEPLDPGFVERQAARPSRPLNDIWRRSLARFGLLLAVCFNTPSTSGSVETSLQNLPDGGRCLVLGRREGPPQALLFIFQGSIESALAEPLYTEVGRILAAEGVLSVVLDAPAHGEDAAPGDPLELNGWAHRVAEGKPFLAPFLQRASAALSGQTPHGSPPVVPRGEVSSPFILRRTTPGSAAWAESRPSPT
jgi:hypothetical protein